MLLAPRCAVRARANAACWSWLAVVPMGLGLAGCTPKPVVTVPVEARVQTAPTERNIRVDGIATVQVSPDLVDVVVDVSDTQERPRAAVAAVGGKRDALVQALRAAGLTGAQVRLGHVDVSPRYRPHPDEHLIDGYEATVRLVVTLTQFDRIGEIMELAANEGATRMHTFFRSTQLPQIKQQARELALAAARAKAEQMARFVGAAVGEVLGIEETASDVPAFSPLSNVVQMQPSPVAADGTQPGAVPLTLTVLVTYALVGPYPSYAGPYQPSRP